MGFPATSTTQANFDPALKQIYRPENVQNLTYDTRPFFAMLAKNEGFGGRNMPIVIQYGNPVGGRSATFASAQANRSHVRLEDFLLTRVSDYQIATIDGEVIESTRGDTYAFLSALKQKVDGSFEALADAIESALFRSGTGSIGQIGVLAANTHIDGATVTTDERIELLQPEEICNFEVDMELVASAADGGALRATPVNSTITRVDRSNGRFNVDDLTAGTDWAVNDFLYVQGDAAAGGTNVKLAGLSAWLPATTTSAAFFGVDRTVDSRLSGIVHTGGLTSTMEEAGIDAQSKIGREGGKADVWLMHNAQYRRLVKELGSKRIYADLMAQNAKGPVASISFRSIVVEGDYGPIQAVAANKCQATISWMLTSGTWKYHTLGPAPKFLMDDGLRILRQAGADGYELRMAMRGNLATKAPIRNARVPLPTP